MIVDIIVNLKYYWDLYFYFYSQGGRHITPYEKTYAAFYEEAWGISGEEEFYISSSSPTNNMDTVILNDETESFVQEMQALVQEDEPIELIDVDFIDKDDQICIEDFVEDAPIPLTGFEKFASAKIIEEKEGPQQWVVTVVGIEDTYIHISDGKRIWVNIGERANKIKNNDVLILDVIRNGKEITVNNILQLDTVVSPDYMIPDEESLAI